MRQHLFKEEQTYIALKSFLSKGLAPSEKDYQFVMGEAYIFTGVRYNHYYGILYVQFDNTKQERHLWYWYDEEDDGLPSEYFKLLTA